MKNLFWLAIAREALIRAGETPSQADAVIDGITGDHRDIHSEARDEAQQVCEQIAVIPRGRPQVWV